MNHSHPASLPLAQPIMRISRFMPRAPHLYRAYCRFRRVRTIAKLVQSQKMPAGTAF
jgi:hypothetical protein